jgi:hypothetical protein
VATCHPGDQRVWHAPRVDAMHAAGQPLQAARCLALNRASAASGRRALRLDAMHVQHSFWMPCMRGFGRNACAALDAMHVQHWAGTVGPPASCCRALSMGWDVRTRRPQFWKWLSGISVWALTICNARVRNRACATSSGGTTAGEDWCG